MALGAHCPRLEERALGRSAALIDVAPCLDIIQSVQDAVPAVEEVVVVNILRLWLDAALVRVDVHARVHLEGGPRGGRGLGMANVRVAKQELAVQIAALDDVVVRHDQFSACLFQAAPHHGKRLQQLAADRPGPHHKQPQLLQLRVGLVAQADDLPVVAALLQLYVIVPRGNFLKVQVKVLVEGCELPRYTLQHLLSYTTTDKRRDGGELSLPRIRHQLDKLVIHLPDTGGGVLRNFAVHQGGLGEDLVGISGPGGRPTAFCIVEGVDRTVGEMDLGGGVQFGKIAEEELGFVQRVGEGSMVHRDDLLHLLGDARPLDVGGGLGTVKINDKLVGARRLLHHMVLAPIQLVHPLDLAEHDPVTLVQPVQVVGQAPDRGLLSAHNVPNDDFLELLAVLVVHLEALPHVDKDRARQPARLAAYETNIVTPAVIVHDELLGEGIVAQTHNRELAQLIQVTQ
mmetsp:Transcript_33024/g.92449  ORF Transcript_33024/g.92449 Transcript_33024/m.92449 type:complete len:457 (-) Transcript_33024:469-1839(-)